MLHLMSARTPAASVRRLKARKRSLSSPTFLSVFSGLGGLDLGLEKAGFTNVGCIEFDPVARESLKANHPRRRLISPHDVTSVAQQLKPRDLGLKRRQLFILAGGPPCQPFSKAAQWSHKAMKGMKDPRAKCFASFIQLIERFLPRVVLIENVQGFVSGRNNAIAKLEKSLRQINKTEGTSYKLSWKVVDASQYGVPQRRYRAILVARRDGSDFKFPDPLTLQAPVTAWEALRGLRVKTNVPARPEHWGELLPSIPEGWNYQWHTRRGGGESLFGYRTRFWSFLLKLSKRAPAWTISAQPGPYTGPFHWKNRPLTKSELLRLQSFPASWKVSGDRADQVRQIGNATPPLLAEIVGRAIATQMRKKGYRSAPKLSIPRARNAIPRREPVTRIPRKFRKLIKKRADHPGTGRGPSPVVISSSDRGEQRKAA